MIPLVKTGASHRCYIAVEQFNTAAGRLPSLRPYQLEPKARRDLADILSATLNSLGDQLLPAS